MQIWTALLNSDYTGFDPAFLTSEVRNLLRELPNKLTVNENPYIQGWICAMLMLKTISLQICQLFNIVLKL